MIRLIFIIVLASVGLIACNIRNTTPQNGEKEEITHTEENNLLSIMTVDEQRGFSWILSKLMHRKIRIFLMTPKLKISPITLPCYTKK
jgi:hypothetical protein